MTRPAFADTCESRLLAFMKPGVWYDSRDLSAIGGTRFAARLHEAQNAGRCRYRDRKKQGTNRFEYRLEAAPHRGPDVSPVPPPGVGGHVAFHEGQSTGLAASAVIPPDSALCGSFQRFGPCTDCGCVIWTGNGRIRHGYYLQGPAGMVDCLGRAET